MSEVANATVGRLGMPHFATDQEAVEQNEVLSLTATHRFAFVRRRWAAGAGTVIQGVLLTTAGGFLLSQVQSTPRLAVQVAIVGGLLLAGGIALFVRAAGDFVGQVSVGPAGLQARLGWAHRSFTWPEVKRWRVRDEFADADEMRSLEIWPASSGRVLAIRGGRMSERDHRQVRQLLQAFAPGREVE